MSLSRLVIHSLRNLNAVDIRPSPRINLIHGQNGTGKTTVLEAINILATGRSFRSHKLKPLIQYGKESFTVFGRIHDSKREFPVGVTRDNQGASQIKVDGSQVSSASALAEHLPVQVIDAHTFQLLEGSPKVRRQFIDWLVFHVEPGFLPAWKDLQRCLKHRNSLLRRGRIRPDVLAPWDQELVQLAATVDRLRQRNLERFFEVFRELVSEFVSVEGLGISYYRGWDKDCEYADLLEANVARDEQRGFTQSGPHRADLRITVNGQNAAELLSRGQQKLLVCALRIAQGIAYRNSTGRTTVYLLDDLPAELDKHHRELLARWLESMQCQVFVTGVEREVLLNSWDQYPDIDKSLFHVEHGRVNLSSTG